MLDFDPLADTIERLPAPLASGGGLPVPKLPFEDEIRAASIATGIPEDLLRAKIQRESQFNPNAIGGVGEIGLAQIRPSTAADPGYGVKPISVDDLRDPAKNAMFGAQYLAARGKAAGVTDWGDPTQAARGLTAYNGGGPNYAASVMKNMSPTSPATPAPIAGPAPSPAAAPAGEPSGMAGRTLGAYRAERENPNNFVSLTNQGAVRNLPIAPTLQSGIASAVEQVFGPGFQARVYSGGQPRPGEGRRVGSTRHDDGNAADVYIYDPEGKRVTGDGLAPLARHWLSNKLGGVGLEMRGGGIHLDTHTDRAPFWTYSRLTPAQQAAVQEGLAARAGQPATAVARAPQEPATAEVVPSAMGRGIGGNTVRSPLADRIMAGLDRPGANASPDAGTEVASASSYAPAQPRGDMPRAFGGQAPIRVAQANIPRSQGEPSMSSSLPLLQPNDPNSPGASDDAPKSAWGGIGDFLRDPDKMDSLMEAIALISNGIPRGVQAKSVAEIAAPFSANRARRGDRQYQMSRDARLDALRQAEIERSTSQWQQSHDLAKSRANQPTVLKADDGSIVSVAPDGSKINTLRDGTPQKTQDILKFEYDMKEREAAGLPRITFREWMQSPGGSKIGLQPIYGTDKDGNPAIVQMSETGNAVQTKLPEGVTISREPMKIDAGTETILIDPITRQPIARIPKNIVQTEAEKEIGSAQGKGQAEAPNLIAKSENMLDTISKVRTHEGRNSFGATGAGSTLPFIGNGIPGTSGRGFIALVDQLKGQSFLEAFNSLKGGGAITEVEGTKATQAIARLDRAQNAKDFDAALNDLESVVRVGMDRARQRMSGGQPQAPAQAPAQAAPSREGAPAAKPGVERREFNGVIYERSGKGWFKVSE